jgi:hypothetical protein
MKRAITISAMMHVMAMWLMVGAPIGCTRGGSGSPQAAHSEEEQDQHQAENDEQRIKDLEQPMEVEIVERPPQPEKSAEQIAFEKLQEERSKCEPFFGGIGVTLKRDDDLNQIADKVHRYYPAEQAGIKPGDVILTPVYKMKGEVGTPVTIEVIRNGIQFSVTMTRGRICLTEVLK